MTLHLKQITQQRLLLTPNVTLALEVLRMPTMELQAFLRQQAEENPLLELEEAEELEGLSAAEEPPAAGSEEPPVAGLTEDWLSHWQHGTAEEELEEGEQQILEQRLVQPQSLHQSLELQLGCQTLSEDEQRIGEALIRRLDEYGYLEGALEDVAAELHADRARIEAVLKTIQRFDPPGVGARDLRECLMLQLEQQEACEGLAYRILRDHFPLFVHHRHQAIAAATGSPLARVEEACESLKRLNPKPGRLFTNDLPPTIVPDLVVHHRERHDDVELNDQDMPQVHISPTYSRMLKDPRTPEEAKAFLVKKFRQAGWLIKAIDERNATLLSIGRCLISLQRDFVEQGPRALKPLTQAQVAHLIGRHPSTVSRAVAGKTIDTPYGVFHLEELFASSVPQAAASHDVSGAAVKSEIQRLIDEEDAHRPLSDQALVQRLAQRHIGVARRTIAKYRTSLKILPAHLRKYRF